MRKSKGFKFICLVMSFICISTILSIVPTTLNMSSNNITGIFVSNMNDGAYGINSNFYMSRAFDNNLMGYLMETTTSTVVDLRNENKETTDFFNKKKKYSQEALNEIKNADYFVINTDTQEINTNTKYKTAKEFEDNVDGECYVKISSNEYHINYFKKFGNNEFNKSNVNSQLEYSVEIPNGDIYISIHKGFLDEAMDWDYISQAKRNFDENIFYVKVIVISAMIAIILGGISIFLYKRNKSLLFDEDSFWLRLSKIIPLEIYVLALLIDVIFFSQGIYYGVPATFIASFLSIGFLMTVIYIFNKQLNTYENKLDFFKTTLVYRIVILIKGIFAQIGKLTRSLNLARRIVVVAIGCLVINFIGVFVTIIDYENYFWGISASILSILIFAYYILKKLSYLSYIMEGTQRIKNGDIHYKIDIVGEDNFTTLAENINNIRDGLDKAIDNQLKSERMKSELITNVSHDLKTPLTSIINYVELIKKEEDITPEYLKDYINVLDSKSKRLKVLIEDLFEASKASSGNIELNMEKIDLIQLLRQSIGEMEEKLSEANLDLKINVPEEKTYIRADGRRLYRVLENLLSNISKYSHPNTRVYIDIIKENNRVKLTMKNISSYELNFDPEEIMERFKRADESRNTEGSGLGLAIARDLVNLQGGSFTIDIDGDLFKSVVEFDLI